MRPQISSAVSSRSSRISPRSAPKSALERLIAHIHSAHPGVPVILDAKRGDIGSTATFYAEEAFDRYGADAVTVNPYLGRDALRTVPRHARTKGS